MMAISLWQPWASLIACGAKPFETRHWSPPRHLIGQTIAIHAAKKIDRDAADFALELMSGDYDNEYAGLSANLKRACESPPTLAGKFVCVTMPIGCVVATARLDAAFHLGAAATETAHPAASVTGRLVSRPLPACFTVRYDDFGDYAPGRWAWLLTEVRAVTPLVAVKGAQGFFNLPQGALKL